MPLPEKLQAARLRCSEQWPYVSSALWALQPVQHDGLGTLGVDKWWRLYYDPELPWTVEECSTVLYHEIQHLLRRHPERAEMQLDCDDRAWNVCADAEINDDIVKETQSKLPAGCIFPKSIGQADGLLAEEYYNALPRQKVPQHGDCGSAAGGQKRAHEHDGPKQDGGKSDTPGLTAAEGELIRHAVANAVQTSSQGDVPDYMKRWAKEILEPKVDWRKVLTANIKHAMAEVAGQVDYTWRKLSRRQGAMPRIVIPAMFAPIPRVSVVVDTSGSMGQDTLDRCIGEVAGILAACGQRDAVRVIACDAAVHTSKRVFSARQVELGGGGGTDMGVGIAHAMKDRPHIIIVLTDGYTPWPDPPRAKVIVGIIGGGNSEGPEWAKTLHIDDVGE